MIIEGITINWLGHDGYKIYENNKFIYIDPFKIPENQEKADYIFITHGHQDHCSVEDIKKLVFEKTTIITTPDCLSKLTNLKVKEIKTVVPGNELSFEGVSVKTVPAYNVNKFRSPGVPFHPKEEEWVGYILTLNGKTIYHAGDTDNIPELQQLQGIDIALLPVSGTYVMTANEAATLANTIQAKTTVPMHYDAIVGTKEDAESFKEKVQGNVVILEKNG